MLSFYVVSDAVAPGTRVDPLTCPPAMILSKLRDQNRLQNFLTAIGPERVYDGLGNCHEACFALLADLSLAGQGLVKSWRWATAMVAPSEKFVAHSHSWLEWHGTTGALRGWACDCGRGEEKVIFQRVAAYRALMKPRDLRLRNSFETARYIQQEAKKREG